MIEKRSFCWSKLSVCAIGVIALSGTSSVLAQAPGEVADLAWCPGAANCLSWTPVAAADAYTLYRGDLTEVQGILSAQADPCIAGAFSEPTTGPLIGDPPPSGAHWYLVAATNASGAGTTGHATDGPRVVEATASCGTADPGVVLNEVDYDQPGADTDEFVEIYNAGSTAADLTDVAVVFVNGSTSAEYARVDLSGVGALAPGAFLVVGATTVIAGLPAGVVAVALPASMQNGAPDGVALVAMGSGTLIDGLSYEGAIRAATIDDLPGTFDLVEGRATTAADTGDGALVRFPDGADTDDALADWTLTPTPTPGKANQAQ